MTKELTAAEVVEQDTFWASLAFHATLMAVFDEMDIPLDDQATRQCLTAGMLINNPGIVMETVRRGKFTARAAYLRALIDLRCSVWQTLRNDTTDHDIVAMSRPLFFGTIQDYDERTAATLRFKQR